jgi:hypothetical protein
MTHEQLITKAREHAIVFERGVPFAARVTDFDRVTVREAAVIRFDSSSRDDHILIYLDRASGDFITAEYAPPTQTEERGET